MLLSTTSINQIVALRLVSGDEIIGRVEYFDDNEIHLEKIRVIVLQPTNSGVNIRMMPWAYSHIDGVIRIMRTGILGYIAPDDQMTTAYQQQTTGIALT